MFTDSLTHAELCRRSLQWLRGSRRSPSAAARLRADHPQSATACGCAVAGTELSVGRDEPDCIGFETGGTSHYVECKASRADFLRDKMKPHRRAVAAGYAKGVGNYRWYFLRGGILQSEWESLGDWGVVECMEDTVRIRKWAGWRETNAIEMAALLVRMMRVVTDGRTCQTGRCLFSVEPWPVTVTDIVIPTLEQTQGASEGAE